MDNMVLVFVCIRDVARYKLSIAIAVSLEGEKSEQGKGKDKHQKDLHSKSGV